MSQTKNVQSVENKATELPAKPEVKSLKTLVRSGIKAGCIIRGGGGGGGGHQG